MTNLNGSTSASVNIIEAMSASIRKDWSFGGGMDTILLTKDDRLISCEMIHDRKEPWAGGFKTTYLSRSGATGNGSISGVGGSRQLGFWRIDTPINQEQWSPDVQGKSGMWSVYVPIKSHSGIQYGYPTVMVGWFSGHTMLAIVPTSGQAIARILDQGIPDDDSLYENRMFSYLDVPCVMKGRCPDRQRNCRTADGEVCPMLSRDESKPQGASEHYLFYLEEPERFSRDWRKVMGSTGSRWLLPHYWSWPETRSFPLIDWVARGIGAGAAAHGAALYINRKEVRPTEWWTSKFFLEEESINALLPKGRRMFMREHSSLKIFFLLWKAGDDMSVSAFRCRRPQYRLSQVYYGDSPVSIHWDEKIPITEFFEMTEEQIVERVAAALSSKERQDFNWERSQLRDTKILLSENPETVLSRQDSLDSGNCPAGTDDFIGKYSLKDGMTFREILNHPKISEMEKNYHFRKVVSWALNKPD